MSVSIVLADDHHVVRQGLRALLEAEPHFFVKGEAGDGLTALQLVENLRPDVLVLDLMMPGLNGLEVTRQATKLSPATKIIILSMHAGEAYVLEALRNGAYGYVLKDSGADELVEAIHTVMGGRRYLSSPLSERAIDLYITKSQDLPEDPYDSLTTREREVLQLAAEGNTNVLIADLLSISPRTAETHRANMMRKLDLHNSTELIRFALQRGIIPMTD
ncbi:MAG: response regulator transcription factor [Caldilineaceae bacterium]|nr:response regulator transcription factor [Caldilineaceae bacterium]MBP8107263.1 response regulator transcription factor [Caldilineaceae bacterium]MBP8122372.1 response regulator transcription factor [Caldilineaceae bacterium]MBP9071077.1 response regulator transcription factor [Caldilineaceae bacterium]